MKLRKLTIEELFETFKDHAEEFYNDKNFNKEDADPPFNIAEALSTICEEIIGVKEELTCLSNEVYDYDP